MGLSKDKERELAKTLFLETTKTQKEIAEVAGVTPKTLSIWVEAGRWEALRAARRSTVGEVVSNLIEIQKARTLQILEAIRGGSTDKFGDEMLKMSKAIEQLQGSLSLSTIIQVLQEFMGFVGGKDHKFRGQLADYQSAFLNHKAGTDG